MHHQSRATATAAINRRPVSALMSLATVWAASLIAGLTGPAPAQEVKPFTIHVEDAVLADLQERLAKTRWPDQVPGSAWTYGVDLGYMQELTEYWRTQYDWRKHERVLNEIPQFMTEIDGLQIHFVHVRSPHAQALPLVLVHGWPGTFVEFTKVIGPLTDPEKHGGQAEDAFHVVCPSLPGFGFSSKPAPPWPCSRPS